MTNSEKPTLTSNSSNESDYERMARLIMDSKRPKTLPTSKPDVLAYLDELFSGDTTSLEVRTAEWRGVRQYITDLEQRGSHETPEQRPVAWMTEENPPRVASADSRDGMHYPLKRSFCVPLYTHAPKAFDGKPHDREYTPKPHSRIAYKLHLSFGDCSLDISFTPRTGMWAERPSLGKEVQR